MKFGKRVFVLGAVLALNQICYGQSLTPAAGSNAPAPPNISGTIFDPSGAPAPGVVLELLPASASSRRQVKSDETGKYTLSRQVRRGAAGSGRGGGTWLIAREERRNLAAVQAVDETTTRLDLNLQPGLTISVRVEDPNGKPITNATGQVGTYWQNSDGTAGRVSRGVNIPPQPGKADDLGRVRFSVLPQGLPYGISFRADGYGAGGQDIPEADTHTAHLDRVVVVLKPANLVLAGRVISADGQPVAGATLLVSGMMQPNIHATSDAKGYFSARVCEGAVTVSANRNGVIGVAQTVGGSTNVLIQLIR
jgi:hypothetical protein